MPGPRCRPAGSPAERQGYVQSVPGELINTSGVCILGHEKRNCKVVGIETPPAEFGHLTHQIVTKEVCRTYYMLEMRHTDNYSFCTMKFLLKANKG